MCVGEWLDCPGIGALQGTCTAAGGACKRVARAILDRVRGRAMRPSSVRLVGVRRYLEARARRAHRRVFPGHDTLYGVPWHDDRLRRLNALYTTIGSRSRHAAACVRAALSNAYYYTATDLRFPGAGDMLNSMFRVSFAQCMTRRDVVLAHQLLGMNVTRFCHRTVSVRLARHHVFRGDRARGMALLDEHVAIHGTTPVLRMVVASVAMLCGDLDRARAYLRQDPSPLPTQWYRMRAEYFIRRRDHRSAIMCVRRYTRSMMDGPPSDVYTCKQLVMVCMLLARIAVLTASHGECLALAQVASRMLKAVRSHDSWGHAETCMCMSMHRMLSSPAFKESRARRPRLHRVIHDLRVTARTLVATGHVKFWDRVDTYTWRGVKRAFGVNDNVEFFV